MADVPLQGIIAASFEAPTSLTPAPRGALSLDLRSVGVSLKPTVFAMQVRGDSMVEAHIQDGDIVLLEPGRPQSGDIVAASLNGCLLLKRFTVIKRVPYLQAENSAQPGRIRATDKPIHGVLRGLLRIQPMAVNEAEKGRRMVKYPMPRRGKAASKAVKPARRKASA